jgi:hypothetical protein
VLIVGILNRDDAISALVRACPISTAVRLLLALLAAADFGALRTGASLMFALIVEGSESD